jgi:hypothetical protein
MDALIGTSRLSTPPPEREDHRLEVFLGERQLKTPHEHNSERSEDHSRRLSMENGLLRYRHKEMIPAFAGVESGWNRVRKLSPQWVRVFFVYSEIYSIHRSDKPLLSHLDRLITNPKEDCDGKKRKI